MNIEGLGESLVEQLVNLDLVKSLSDIYRLIKESLTYIEGIDDKVATNIL